MGELSTFIKIFDFYKNQRTEQISQLYFRIQHEPEVRTAFYEYLENLESMENIEDFEIKTQDLSTIIDNIFFAIGDINRLFETTTIRKNMAVFA